MTAPECIDHSNLDRARVLAWKDEAEQAQALVTELRAEVGRLHAMVEKPIVDALEEARLWREEADRLSKMVTDLAVKVQELEALLNAPEIHDFIEGVKREAPHQRKRWGVDHDAGKTPADWFWLIGYLAGKALHAHIAGSVDKALHHTISTAAALCNWHSHILGKTNMRPGIAPPEGVDDG